MESPQNTIIEHVRMSWGMHKGRPIFDVPADYLRWVVKENKWQAEFAELELQRRRAALKGV